MDRSIKQKGIFMVCFVVFSVFGYQVSTGCHGEKPSFVLSQLLSDNGVSVKDKLAAIGKGLGDNKSSFASLHESDYVAIKNKQLTI